MNLDALNVNRCGEGIPVIMLHGFSIDQTSLFAACEPVFSIEPFKRIYFDQPGMGNNSAIEGIKNADDMIQCISVLIKELIGDEDANYTSTVEASELEAYQTYGYEDQFMLSQKYKRATYMALDGAGHGLHMDKEKVFNQILKQWIDDIKQF